MIIKGRCRGFADQLAVYLRDQKNERVKVIEAGAAGGLAKSLRDMEKLAATLTDSRKPLYHVCMRLAANEALTPRQWQQSADRLEKALTLAGQDRVMVLHTLPEGGGTHAHVVWSRVDTEQGRVISNSWDAVQWHKTARALEREFGLQQLESRIPPERSGQSRNQAQASKARRLQDGGGKDTEIIRREVTFCWEQSATGREFKEQLAGMGYELRQGDRSAYVLIDQSTGKPYNPARLLDGIRTKDLRARCGDLATGSPRETATEKPHEAFSYRGAGRIVSQRFVPGQQSKIDDLNALHVERKPSGDDKRQGYRPLPGQTQPQFGRMLKELETLPEPEDRRAIGPVKPRTVHDLELS